MDYTDLPPPIAEFARQNCWTARRCRLAFKIHQQIDRFEGLIGHLLSVAPAHISMISPFQSSDSDNRVIRLSEYAKIAPVGAMFDECRGISFFSRVLAYPRLLIIPSGSDRLFYIHGTLTPSHGLIWDWRTVDRLEEQIHYAAVMVMQHSVRCFLEADLKFYLGLMQEQNHAASTINLTVEGGNAFLP